MSSFMTRSVTLALCVALAGLCAAEDDESPSVGIQINGGQITMVRNGQVIGSSSAPAMRFAGPDLGGVNPMSPEGKAKIEEWRKKRMAEHDDQIRKMAANATTAAHRDLRTLLGMTPEEFAACEPMISRIEHLRVQGKSIANAWTLDERARSYSMFNIEERAFADLPQEQSVIDAKKAMTQLETLLKDAQAKPEEIEETTAKLRAARSAFATVLSKAQDALRSVLTKRQESLLVNRGLLD